MAAILQKELPKLSLPKNLLEERVQRNTELWKKIFDLYATDGKLEGEQMFSDMLHGAGSGFLVREIEDVYTGLGKPHKMMWNDLKGLCGKEPALAIAWDAQAKVGKGSDMIAIDVFEQLFVSFQYLLDSSPDPTKLDVSYLAYLLSSCGEELNTDTYDEFIKTIGHTTKGAFSLSLFLTKYSQFAKKVGVFTDEDMEKAQIWIDRAEEKYGIKKKVHKPRPPVEEKKEEPPPEAAPVEGAPAGEGGKRPSLLAAGLTPPEAPAK